MMTAACPPDCGDCGGDAEAVCEDFETTMDWRKWVCVVPSNAMIATKDNMVLCLMGSDQIYTLTAPSIEATGWNVYVTLGNPDMQKTPPCQSAGRCS